MARMTIEHVARIEGHGNIAVSMNGEGAIEVRLDVVEPARFFESMLVGRRFDQAPLITSRICGICSPNHAVTSIKALEMALDVSVSERTTLLRKLLVYASYLQNHATHLYLLAAPDYVGEPSVLPLAHTDRDVLLRALKIKKLGNELTTLVGGRPVHPVTPVVGGFTSEPDLRRLESFRSRLIDIAEDAADTAALFATFAYPEFATDGEMLALVADDDYAVYDGEVKMLGGGRRRHAADYARFIDEVVIAHSNAKHSTVGGRPFLVGSLARVNLSADKLDPGARKVLDRVGVTVPCTNPFINNVCQAVELVDAARRCAGYIETLLDMGGSSQPVAFELRSGIGAAATEAPRGTLYHSCVVNQDGTIARYDVLTPTAQNLANLEADMRAFAPRLAGRPDPEVQLGMERLVRAYDPCLSCSVH